MEWGNLEPCPANPTKSSPGVDIRNFSKMSTDAAANEDVSITLQHNHWDGTKNRHEVTIASVEALQAKAVEITGIPVAQLVLQVGGRKLWVGRPLAKQGVVENTVVTVEDRDGWQHKHGELQKALYDAIQADNGDEAVRLLTEQNADPNTPQAPNGYGPAHFAAMRSSVRPLNALCDAGANVNQSYEDLGGGTVLQFAVQNFDHDPELGLSMTEALCFPPPDVSFVSGVESGTCRPYSPLRLSPQRCRHFRGGARSRHAMCWARRWVSRRLVGWPQS